VALNQSEEDKTTISNGTINDLKALLTEEEFIMLKSSTNQAFWDKMNTTPLNFV